MDQDKSPEEGNPDLEKGKPGPKGSMKDRLDWRDQQKQRGVIEREPSPEEKKKIQPTHQVD